MSIKAQLLSRESSERFWRWLLARAPQIRLGGVSDSFFTSIAKAGNAWYRLDVRGSQTSLHSR